MPLFPPYSQELIERQIEVRQKIRCGNAITARLAIDLERLLVGPTCWATACALADQVVEQGPHEVALALYQAAGRYLQATLGPMTQRVCSVRYVGATNRTCSRIKATHLTTKVSVSIPFDTEISDRDNAEAVATKLFGRAPEFCASLDGGGWICGVNPMTDVTKGV